MLLHTMPFEAATLSWNWQRRQHRPPVLRPTVDRCGSPVEEHNGMPVRYLSVRCCLWARAYWYWYWPSRGAGRSRRPRNTPPLRQQQGTTIQREETQSSHRTFSVGVVDLPTTETPWSLLSLMSEHAVLLLCIASS
jgi:hypothetical protein